MLKRAILITILIALVYVTLVNFQLYMMSRRKPSTGAESSALTTDLHTVYRFSFSKYKTTGDRELEIEGDSADIFTHEVALQNVIAKAYAEETPVVITANHGTFEKSSGVVHLNENVVATTDEGARLLTEKLDVHSGEKRLETDAPAEVKTEGIDVRGTSAVGDSKLKKVKFDKNVTVTMRDAARPEAQPTVITCDGPLDIDYAKGIGTFYGNVLAQDERGDLRADRMDVYHDQKTEQVDKIIATGNVEIKKPDGSTTYSDSVIYYAKDGRMVLGGDPEALVYRDEDSQSDPLGIEETGLGSKEKNADQEREVKQDEEHEKEKLPSFLNEGIV